MDATGDADKVGHRLADAIAGNRKKLPPGRAYSAWPKAARRQRWRRLWPAFIRSYNRKILAYSSDQIIPVRRPFGGRWFDDATVPQSMIEENLASRPGRASAAAN